MSASQNFHASMRRSSFDGGVYLKVVRDIFRIKRPELMPFLLRLHQGRDAYSEVVLLNRGRRLFE